MRSPSEPNEQSYQLTISLPRRISSNAHRAWRSEPTAPPDRKILHIGSSAKIKINPRVPKGRSVDEDAARPRALARAA